MKKLFFILMVVGINMMVYGQQSSKSALKAEVYGQGTLSRPKMAIQVFTVINMNHPEFSG